MCHLCKIILVNVFSLIIYFLYSNLTSPRYTQLFFYMLKRKFVTLLHIHLLNILQAECLYVPTHKKTHHRCGCWAICDLQLTISWECFKLQADFQANIPSISLRFLRFNCERLVLVRFQNFESHYQTFWPSRYGS